MWEKEGFMLKLWNDVVVNNTKYQIIDIEDIGNYTYYLLEDSKFGDETEAAVAVFYEDIEISFMLIIDYTWDSLSEWSNDYYNNYNFKELDRFTKKKIQEEYNKKYNS